MPANYSPEEIRKAHEVLYSEGIKMRYMVAGKEYVDRSLKAASDPFRKPMQEVSLRTNTYLSCVPSATNSTPSMSPKQPGAGRGHVPVSN
jgi:hypothetical protein